MTHDQYDHMTWSYDSHGLSTYIDEIILGQTEIGILELVCLRCFHVGLNLDVKVFKLSSTNL